ncbi:MAG: DUF2484 family protein [Hasllibacter sp.]
MNELIREPLFWVAVWVVTAAVLSAFPSRRHHWPLAYVLIAAGAPILVWSFLEGPLTGLAALVAGVTTLRWPARHALRWLKGRLA